MVSGLSQLISWDVPINRMKTTPVDSDGTCRIYYCCPKRGNSSFVKPSSMANVRNIELDFHMYPDNIHNRGIYPRLPTMNQFMRECPIWHFIDLVNKGRRPTCNIIVNYHGKGELPFDYDAMLNLLLGLTESLTLSGFEEVVVRVVPGLRFDSSKCRLPSEMSMTLLKLHFENYMGPATGIDAGEESRMEFHPRQLGERWLQQRRAAMEAQAKSINAPLGCRQKARREIRSLLQGHRRFAIHDLRALR